MQEARQLLDALSSAGVDYDDLTETLEREGVEKFADSFAELSGVLANKREALAPA